jgi:hypothetical protein
MAGHHTEPQPACSVASAGRPHWASYNGPRKYRPSGGKVGAADLAAARGQHLVDPLGALVAAADAQQAAHEVADHVVQEGIGLELEMPAAALAVATPRDLDAAQVFTGDLAWQAEARNELKSCSPSSAAAALRIASPSSGCIDQPTRPAVEAGPHRRLRAARRGSGGPGRWRGNGTRRAPAAPTARRCRAAGSGWCRAPRRRARARWSVSKCTTCIRPCTPASVRPAHSVDRATGCAANFARAASSLSCTVRPERWLCQPSYAWPL